jgi:UDPglucose--hexose-1-phosphate uridylyltransferase
MPELRQNYFTKEWVIIATERAKRPEELATHRPAKIVPPFVKTCPFCVGNESKTPPEVMRVPTNGGGPWQVRVVANKFAALSPEVQPIRTIHRSRRSMGGFGVHDVIIDTPDHSHSIASMADVHITNLLRVYKSRYDSLSLDPRIAHVTIFKNHGTDAGASLEHPHSQLIATPVISHQVRETLPASLEPLRRIWRVHVLPDPAGGNSTPAARRASHRPLRCLGTLCLANTVLHSHLSTPPYGQFWRYQQCRDG